MRQRQAAIRRAAVIYFVVAFVSMMWPVYPLFSGIHPMVLGLPLSLLYQVFWLALSFLVLLALYRWERRNGALS